MCMPHSDAVTQYRHAVTQYRHAATQYHHTVTRYTKIPILLLFAFLFTVILLFYLRHRASMLLWSTASDGTA